MSTTRCNAAEREVFERRSGNGGNRCEPVLGTLDERLGILVRRLGGTTGVIRASDQERRDYLAYLASDATAGANPYARA